jgi:hypothetical protein
MKAFWFGAFLIATIGFLLSLAMKEAIEPENLRGRRLCLIIAIVCATYVIIDIVVDVSEKVAATLP